MKKFSSIEWVALAVILIGAINWGLVGLFKFDLVGMIFGDMSIASRLVYFLVGLAAVAFIAMLPNLSEKS